MSKAQRLSILQCTAELARRTESANFKHRLESGTSSQSAFSGWYAGIVSGCEV